MPPQSHPTIPLVTYSMVCLASLSLSQLDEDDFRTKLKAEEAKLKSLLPPDREEGEGEDGGGGGWWRGR